MISCRKFQPKRPDCRRAKDNLKPVGELQTETELKTSYPQLEVRRPSSAREEFKRNRDSLRTEGKVRTYDLFLHEIIIIPR